MYKGLVPFLSAKEIDQIIEDLASAIQKDFSNTELILICPLRGSIFFLSDLIRKLKIPVKVDFVFLESLGEEHFRIKKDISLPLEGRNVLIVEEIIDSGLTFSFLKERIKWEKPACLKTVVLLDKSSHRKIFAHADYVGRVIADRFIVGYGMDIDEEGRNYPDMYHLGQ